MIRTALWRVGFIAAAAAVVRMVTQGETGQLAKLLRSVPGSIKSVLRETLLRASSLLE